MGQLVELVKSAGSIEKLLQLAEAAGGLDKLAELATAAGGLDKLLGVGEAPDIGSKLEYFLGRATGSAHNIERSQEMLRQLERIGLPDTAATRQLLTDLLASTLRDQSNIASIQANGRVVRDALLAGPRGFLKFETIWQGAKLITGNLFGKG